MADTFFANRCQIVGILNLTPDSFSDGGRYSEIDHAVKRAFAIQAEGADWLDVGGESTRPGTESISLEEERQRVLPVLRELKKMNYTLPISLDTTKPDLAAEALSQNLVQVINDVQGLRDKNMVEVISTFKCPVIVMHMFGTPRVMQETYRYENVVRDIKKYFEEKISQCQLDPQKTILDPGIGFGKSVEHNLEILNHLDSFISLGCPVMVGASRKSFIGKVLTQADPADRLWGSLAVAATTVMRGANFLRVHDVKETKNIVTMVEAIKNEKISS